MIQVGYFNWHSVGHKEPYVWLSVAWVDVVKHVMGISLLGCIGQSLVSSEMLGTETSVPEPLTASTGLISGPLYLSC